MALTKLDRAIFRMLDQHPAWAAELGADELRMLGRRKTGASYRQLAEEFHLTPAGVRFRLYGDGAGATRHGGVWGKLHGLVRRDR